MDRNALLAQKGQPVLGFRGAKRIVASGKATLVVVAQNCPAAYVETLKKSGATVESFDGSSRDLGVIYGKPFNVSVLALTDAAVESPKRRGVSQSK